MQQVVQRVIQRQSLVPTAVALACGSLALAQTAAAPRLATPVFSQLVMFSLPPEFKSAKATYEKNSGSFYLREQVPEGESLAKWSRMIILSGTRGLAGNPEATPQRLLARMTLDFQRNCPDTFSTNAPGEQKIDGYDAYEVIVSCGRVQSDKQVYGLSAVMLTVKGAKDFYTLQWTERGHDSAQPPTIDSAYWARQLARLTPIRLCPIVPGEAAPYPSCTTR
jgi:hypothetical protein